MTDYAALLAALGAQSVDFILVGGLAATAHGSARLTADVDVVYRRSTDNYQRMVAALGPRDPYLRGAPPGLPFRWDEQTIERGLNFTLTTSIGAINLLGEIAGGGTYDELAQDHRLRHTVPLSRPTTTYPRQTRGGPTQGPGGRCRT